MTTNSKRNAPTDMIKIAALNDIFEYDILTQILKENQIPAVFRSYTDSAYGELFLQQKGWGSVSSLPQHQEEILALLQEIRSAQSSASIAEAEAEEACPILDPKDRIDDN